MPKLHLVTYGCQMNEYDSERVAGLLKDERYELTDSPDDADLSSSIRARSGKRPRTRSTRSRARSSASRRSGPGSSSA